jgi:hypothetical protein
VRADCGGQSDHRDETKEQALRKFHASEYTTSRGSGADAPVRAEPPGSASGAEVS